MPGSINGIGSGLVTVSSKRVVNGLQQFDAMEAFIFLYLPVFPYKLIHIISMHGDQYHALPLRWTGRLVLKGLLNGWSNALLFCGVIFAPLLSIIFFTLERPLKRDDWVMLGVSLTALVLGLVLKGVWCWLDGRDRRIKELIGSHDCGSSDPYDWPTPVADSYREALLTQEGKSSLLQVAEQALRTNEVAKAMVSLRLAMRDPLERDLAQLSLEQILSQDNEFSHEEVLR